MQKCKKNAKVKNLLYFEMLEDIKMARVQTSVMIDEDKRQLAKQRGLKLQDILDEALDMALHLEITGKAQLEIEKDNILKEIEHKKKQKEEYLEKYQRDIDELNIRLKFIDKQLAGAIEEQKQKDKLKEYKELLERARINGAWDGELDEELTQFCLKYKIADINTAFAEANNDLINVYNKTITIDEIKKAPGSGI